MMFLMVEIVENDLVATLFALLHITMRHTNDTKVVSFKGQIKKGF